MYKQLSYLMFEIYTVTGHAYLLFELLRAPVEHFPESFPFLVTYFSQLVEDGRVKTFNVLFDSFVKRASPNDVILAVDDDSLFQIHGKRVPAVTSLSIKFVRQGKFKLPLYTEDLQVKVWQFLLIPLFTVAFRKKKKVHPAEVSRIYSLFIPFLKSFHPYDISEDLIICFVQFSLLLLKHSSESNFDNTDTLFEFSHILDAKHYSLDEPFRCSVNDYGKLLASALHVYLPPAQGREGTTHDELIMKLWTLVLEETKFPEIAEQALLLVPQVLSRFNKMTVHLWMSPMLTVVHKLYHKGVAALTDDTKMDAIVMDAIKAFMTQEYLYSSLRSPQEEKTVFQAVDRVINVLFLFVWKKAHLSKFLDANCYLLLIAFAEFYPRLMEKFLIACILIIQDSSCPADIICASLRCLCLLIRSPQKYVFETIMGGFMNLFPPDKTSENPRPLSSQNRIIAKLTWHLLDVMFHKLHDETFMEQFTYYEKLSMEMYFKKIFYPFYSTRRHTAPSTPELILPLQHTIGIRIFPETSAPDRKGYQVSLSRSWGASLPHSPEPRSSNSPKPRTSNSPKARAANSPKPRTSSSPKPRMSNSPEPRASSPNSSEPRASTPNPPEPIASNSREPRVPLPIIPKTRTPVPGPSIPEARISGLSAALWQSQRVSSLPLSAEEPQCASVASFPWQDINSESFHVKCIQFMFSTVVNEDVRSGSPQSSLAIPTNTISGNKAATSDVKRLLKREIEFQSFLMNVNTEHFKGALLRQCQLDPALAEYVWFAMFPVVLSYKESDEKLLDQILKNPRFPTISEKALRMILPNISTDFEQNFIRGPNFTSVVTLDSEKKLFERKQPKVTDIEQVYSCYFNMGAEDLTYGLFHIYLPETSVALAYENVGLFAEAKEEYLDVLESNSVRRFPSYQKCASRMGYQRCVEKLTRWDSISGEKFIDCKGALDSEKLDSTCDCPQEKDADSLVSFCQMYFLLCPWNVRRDMMRKESKISETLNDIHQLVTFQLKKIPSVTSPEFMRQLQRAARVSEFERSHIILKSFFEVEDERETATLFKEEFSKRSVLDDVDVWDDIHGARLRVLSLFLQCGLTDENILAATLYNDFFLRVASKTLEQGKVNSCLEYLRKVKNPISQESLELRTEMVLRTINAIEKPVDREELLKMILVPFQMYDGRIDNLQQAKCCAYMGLLKSLPGASWVEHACTTSMIPFKGNVDKLFQKSINFKPFSKNHEWFGNYLEKIFISTRIAGRPNNLKTAKRAIEQFILACRFKGSIEAQVPLAKVMGLLLHDEELENVLVQKKFFLPSEFWLPLLPQLLEIACSSTRKQLHPLLEWIGNKFPQSLFFAFKELRSSKEKYPETFSRDLVNTIRRIQTHNSKLLFTLEKIGEELFSLKNVFCDDTLSRLRGILESICNLAYACIVKSGAARESSHLQNLLEITLQKGLVAEIANILQMRENLDRSLVEELEELSPKSYNVWELTSKLLLNLTNIIECWEKSKKPQIKSLYIYSTFLSTFHLYGTEVEMFRNWVPQSEDSVLIARFLPKLEILQRHNTYTCRIYILGSDGKEYSYLVVPVSRPSKKENRVFQLFSFLNRVLGKDKSLPRFSIPSIIPFPNVCLTEDNKRFNSYLWIYTSSCLKLKFHPVVIHHRLLEYYITLENKNLKPMSDENIRCTIFNKLQKLVPKTIFKDWVQRNCRNSVDFILFRKKFSREIALVAFAKYCFSLHLQTPDNLFINKMTGALSSFGLKFNFQLRPTKLKQSQSTIAEKGNCTWPPLQLTPNMLELLHSSGMQGSVVLTMAAIARCFNKNKDGIEAMLNILISKELGEGANFCCIQKEIDEICDSSSAFDEAIFRETRRNIKEISELIEECAGCGTYKKLHSLVSDSFQIKNMSLSNPLIFPWF